MYWNQQESVIKQPKTAKIEPSLFKWPQNKKVRPLYFLAIFRRGLCNFLAAEDLSTLDHFLKIQKILNFFFVLLHSTAMVAHRAASWTAIIIVLYNNNTRSTVCFVYKYLFYISFSIINATVEGKGLLHKAEIYMAEKC